MLWLLLFMCVPTYFQKGFEVLYTGNKARSVQRWQEERSSWRQLRALSDWYTILKAVLLPGREGLASD